MEIVACTLLSTGGGDAIDSVAYEIIVLELQVDGVQSSGGSGDCTDHWLPVSCVGVVLLIHGVF